MHGVWPIVLLLLPWSAGDRPAIAPVTRVRAADNARWLLDEAARHSPTIRGLIARLAGTDAIVYVEFTPSPQIELARTKLVTSTASARFLRIGLSTTLSPYETAPLLGHELQHAVEIAEHADVRDDAGLRRLYQRIGRRRATDNYETDAAGDVERRVRAEMRSRLPGS